MAINTRRRYITEDQVEQFSDITVTDETEAEDRMSMAEEMIDMYVGPQEKFYRGRIVGKATAGAAGSLTDSSSDSPLDDGSDGYLTFCEVEIIGGTGAGQKRTITAHDVSAGQISVAPDFTVTPDTTSVYRVSQLAKFPRQRDYEVLDNVYYKFIPEAVTRAALAQFEFMLEKGSDFFSGATDYSEEWQLDYKYVAQMGVDRFISPYARRLLRGIMNRKGRFV